MATQAYKDKRLAAAGKRKDALTKAIGLWQGNIELAQSELENLETQVRWLNDMPVDDDRIRAVEAKDAEVEA